MASVDTSPETSDVLLEMASKVFPRRNHRFQDLRPYQDACEWADTLDWRNNPYDRFLLRREILHHLEIEAFHGGKLSAYSFVGREQIAEEIDYLLDHFPVNFNGGVWNIFKYVLLGVPVNLSLRRNDLGRLLGR